MRWSRIATLPTSYASALAQEHECKGYGGVDCIDDWVASYEDDGVTESAMALYDAITSMTYGEKIRVIPFLLRLGYSITYWPNDEPDLACPFSLTFPGKASTPKYREGFSVGSIYLYSTSPGMMRLRGVMWCTPRLLRWRDRALKPYYHPDAPGGMANIAAGVEMVNGM